MGKGVCACCSRNKLSLKVKCFYNFLSIIIPILRGKQSILWIKLGASSAKSGMETSDPCQSAIRNDPLM